MMRNLSKYIGSLIVYSTKHSIGITKFSFLISFNMVKTPPKIKNIIFNIYTIGYKSLPFITIIMALLGGILVTQFGVQAVRLTGTGDEVGGPYLQLLVRQFGPFITGMMLAIKVSTSIATEISLMKTTDQIDALKMAGIDPIKEIVTPKIIAGILTTFALVIYGVIVAEFSGAFIAWKNFGVNPYIFINLQFVTFEDIIQGVIKTSLIGFYIPLVGCYGGLNSETTSEGVGRTTNITVVMALSAVGVIDLFGGAFSFLFLT